MNNELNIPASVDSNKCAVCGKDLDYDEQIVCDECLEEKLFERLEEMNGNE